MKLTEEQINNINKVNMAVNTKIENNPDGGFSITIEEDGSGYLNRIMGELCQKHREAKERGEIYKEKVKRATKGAAAGCKPGSSRHTYVMPNGMIQKIKAISGYFGKPEVAIVLDILEKGIAEYEEQYGPQVSDLSRGRG